LFYSFNPAIWLNLRPGMQYAHQPGGVAHNTDDVVAGLRLAINL
jgi:porin